MRLKSASLEIIAKANGKLTGDELRKKERDDAEQKRREAIAELPKYMSPKQRARLRKVLRNGNSDTHNA